MPSSMIGRKLGDFEVQAEIGKGSMARVYKAWQGSLHRHVGLKVLEEGLFTPGENIKRFLREAAALARLEHPHIVPIYAAGEETPYYFFAMRLLNGGTLAEAMEAGVDLYSAVEWARQICSALAYTHRLKIVHRDLKPTNVLLQENTAFLSDYGLARLSDFSTLTRKGFALGTPLYMSPEQTLGQEAGPASDCFSLGVILYQLLTGKHPFVTGEMAQKPRAEKRTMLFLNIREAKHAQVSKLNAEVPPALEAVVETALRPDAAERYPGAEAMLEDLEKAWRLVTEGGRRVPAARLVFESSDKRAAVPSAAAEGSTEVEIPLDAAPAVDKSKDGRRFGRYLVRHELGHGGQGVVYRAHDPVLDRDVALKVLQAHLQPDREMFGLFRHEARVAARMYHPHIIPIFDFGVHEGSPFLTMPMIEGPSLDRLLARAGALPAGFCLRVLMQCGEAFACAHERGVVHMDIKPGNILLRHVPETGERNDPLRDPGVVITDFTLARMFRHEREGHAIEDTVAGTIGYAAPEQLAGIAETGLGPECDYYALGVVFHEMLTGRRLFAHAERAHAQRLVPGQQVTPPSRLRSGLPEGVDELCLAMLAEDPQARLASTKELTERAMPILAKLG